MVEGDREERETKAWKGWSVICFKKKETKYFCMIGAQSDKMFETRERRKKIKSGRVLLAIKFRSYLIGVGDYDMIRFET